ncbi:uncharacterized protein [Symphalangus syndactylus]|uniref:uncharacterized protein n=1 Tax=Symphalangus syndactylus TaxID=9590 RepID=UPI0030074818
MAVFQAVQGPSLPCKRTCDLSTSVNPGDEAWKGGSWALAGGLDIHPERRSGLGAACWWRNLVIQENVFLKPRPGRAWAVCGALPEFSTISGSDQENSRTQRLRRGDKLGHLGRNCWTSGMRGQRQGQHRPATEDCGPTDDALGYQLLHLEDDQEEKGRSASVQSDVSKPGESNVSKPGVLVIPALWEAEAGGSPEVGSLRPA